MFLRVGFHNEKDDIVLFCTLDLGVLRVFALPDHA